MTLNTIIRQAQLEDLDNLAELFNAYRLFYQQADDFNLGRKFLAERLSIQDSTLFVATTQAGKLIGFAQLYPIFSSLSAKKAWILNDLYVLPESRQSGAATRLIQKSITFCREHQASWLSLQTAQDNFQAQKLYERIGFVRDEHYLTYVLEL